MSVRRITALTAAGLLAATLPVAAATTAQARPTADATVSVLHAVPGATVDVYANGKALLTDFTPGTLTDPLKLPEGEYDLKVTAAGAGAGGAAVIQANDVAVPGGANVTVVAHLNAAGKPTLTPFVNDVSKLAAGKARLTVRHTAAAPAVDIRAGGRPVFSDVTNGKEGMADVDAGSVSADVVLAGTQTRVLGPADLDLREGTATIVYAVGSAEDKTLDVVAQTISGLHSAPGGVPSGDGGRADRGLSLPWYGVGGAGILLMLFGAARLATGVRRR